MLLLSRSNAVHELSALDNMMAPLVPMRSSAWSENEMKRQVRY
jgi:hypothetical protein